MPRTRKNLVDTTEAKVISAVNGSQPVTIPEQSEQPELAMNTILISDACQQLETSEQAFRLALQAIRPDDFDSVDAIAQHEFETIAETIQQKALPIAPQPEPPPEPPPEPQTEPQPQPEPAPLVQQAPQVPTSGATQMPTSIEYTNQMLDGYHQNELVARDIQGNVDGLAAAKSYVAAYRRSFQGHIEAHYANTLQSIGDGLEQRAQEIQKATNDQQVFEIESLGKLKQTSATAISHAQAMLAKVKAITNQANGSSDSSLL